MHKTEKDACWDTSQEKGHFSGNMKATSQEKGHFSSNMQATSQENATTWEMAFKLTIHFTGKCDHIGYGMTTMLQPSSLKLSLGCENKYYQCLTMYWYRGVFTWLLTLCVVLYVCIR